MVDARASIVCVHAAPVEPDGRCSRVFREGAVPHTGLKQDLEWQHARCRRKGLALCVARRRVLRVRLRIRTVLFHRPEPVTAEALPPLAVCGDARSATPDEAPTTKDGETSSLYNRVRDVREEAPAKAQQQGTPFPRLARCLVRRIWPPLRLPGRAWRFRIADRKFALFEISLPARSRGCSPGMLVAPPAVSYRSRPPPLVLRVDAFTLLPHF